MSHPRNQQQEVLYHLIWFGVLTQTQTARYGIRNHTAKISELRNDWGVSIDCILMKKKNKFGRAISYGKWELTKRTKTKAKAIYKKMQKLQK